MASTTATIRVAAVQMRSGRSRDANIAAARVLMDRARVLGAHLIALPENYSFLGNDDEKLRVAETVSTGESVSFLQSYARQHGVALIGGSVPLKSEAPSKVTNTCLAIDESGDIVARYDKIHLFDIALDPETTFSESAFVEAGSDIVTVDLCGLRIGLSICYDVRFPELYRALARDGAQVLFVPAAFTLQTGRDHWEVLLRARAVENLCYVVAPAQQGRHSDRRQTFGRSMIVGPWGQILAQAQDEPGVVVGDIDIEYLQEMREKLPCLGHVREDVFRI